MNILDDGKNYYIYIKKNDECKINKYKNITFDKCKEVDNETGKEANYKVKFKGFTYDCEKELWKFIEKCDSKYHFNDIWDVLVWFNNLFEKDNRDIVEKLLGDFGEIISYIYLLKTGEEFEYQKEENSENDFKWRGNYYDAKCTTTTSSNIYLSSKQFKSHLFIVYISKTFGGKNIIKALSNINNCNDVIREKKNFWNDLYQTKFKDIIDSYTITNDSFMTILEPINFNIKKNHYYDIDSIKLNIIENSLKKIKLDFIE